MTESVALVRLRFSKSCLVILPFFLSAANFYASCSFCFSTVFRASNLIINTWFFS